MKTLNILAAGAGALLLASCANTGQMDLNGPQLVGGEWVAVGDNTTMVTDAVKTTIAFDDKGHVSGNAGCNAYTAHVYLGPMFGYMNLKDFAVQEKACEDEAVTEQEGRVTDILSAAKYYRFDDAGDLLITSEDGSELHLRRNAG